MHRTALSRPQRRTRRSRHLWPRTLENRLPRHRTARSRPHRRSGRWARLNRLRRRRLVNWTRPSLRNDHPRWRSRRGRRLCWRSCYWLRRRSTRSRRWWCNRRSCLHGRIRHWLRRWCCRTNRRRRCCGTCRSGCRRWSRRPGRRCNRRCRRPNNRSRWPRGLRCDETRRWRRRCCRFRRRRRRRRHAGRGRGGSWLGFNWGRARNWRTWRSRRRSGCCCLLLLRDQLQHVAWLGDVRQVDLCLDFVGFAPSAGRARRRTRLGGFAEVGSHFLRLVVLKRAGVRLLFGNPNFGENIKDGLALDFQFSGQIVNSNLTHLPFLCSAPAP
jgi:hypothetical protein